MLLAKKAPIRKALAQSGAVLKAQKRPYKVRRSSVTLDRRSGGNRVPNEYRHGNYELKDREPEPSIAEECERTLRRTRERADEWITLVRFGVKGVVSCG